MTEPARLSRAHIKSITVEVTTRLAIDGDYGLDPSKPIYFTQEQP